MMVCYVLKGVNDKVTSVIFSLHKLFHDPFGECIHESLFIYSEISSINVTRHL